MGGTTRLALRPRPLPRSQIHLPLLQGAGIKDLCNHAWLTLTSFPLTSDLDLQVLDVLCSLCVCNGVAVRSNQDLITENLLPGRELLLQTNLINYVTRCGS